MGEYCNFLVAVERFAQLINGKAALTHDSAHDI